MERILKITEDFKIENPLLKQNFKKNDELYFGCFSDTIFYFIELNKEIEREGVVILKIKDDNSGQSVSLPLLTKDKFTLYNLLLTNYPTLSLKK